MVAHGNLAGDDYLLIEAPTSAVQIGYNQILSTTLHNPCFRLARKEMVFDYLPFFNCSECTDELLPILVLEELNIILCEIVF